jgi:hypothetical protein
MEEIIIVILNESDFDTKANMTPIIGCKYTKTATSAEVNLVNA